MKALVLAGGSGSRLRPITHTSAKQLVPVANKPVLFYGLESIAAAGVRETGIVTGDTAAEIENAVGDGSRFGLDVTYLRQEAPLGLAHGVLIAREYLGDDDFVMYLGDNFIVGGFADLAARFREQRPAAQLMLTRTSTPQAFGVAELDSAGRVVGLEEKPARPKSDLALAGVYMFTPAVHAVIANLKPSVRGELEITDAIQGLIDAGERVDSATITGYWKDTGNVDDMLEVNRNVLETLEPRIAGTVTDSELVGRVVVAEGAQVVRSRIVGPVTVGPDAVIHDSYIGPFTSIEGGCRINASEIEYSIVLRGASIEGMRRIERSLIGRESQIVPAPPTPRAHRLVLGDHSQVRIST
ncbi:glucose-1-phosphate thymidylyltransferase [Nocardiopsis sp. NPDC058631]|uniref:glucose-1-phosphate thymidylyltransferase n=1 Tax=Nocardiopsis sp. NPDC058631 TaxID=3346566 RepID=UPI0036624EBC